MTVRDGHSYALKALALRVGIALATRTFFQPDEYFQSLEPAHCLVFGYGHLTWEWTSATPIRSFLYPALNVPLYWLLKITGWHQYDILMIYGPKVLHGCLASLTDIWLCRLTRQILGDRFVPAAFFLSSTSFFHSLSLSRSLSNSLETSLSTVAFCFYPWDATDKFHPNLIFDRHKIRMLLTTVAVCCAIRPTNAVLWAFLLGNLYWSLRRTQRLVWLFLADGVLIGGVAALLLFSLDSLYYGKPTFTPISFLMTNLSGVSLFYGGNAWHYYLSQAFPILTTTALPFVVHGVYTAIFRSSHRDVPQRTMVKAITWTMLIYSLAGHKEWRFIHPLLPLMHLLAAKSLVTLSPDTQTRIHKTATGKETRSSGSLRGIYVALLCLNVPVAIYTTVFYNSAPIFVAAFIRGLPVEHQQRGSVGFLMPCHSTPGQAYLHREALAHGAWALGCEPPLTRNDTLPDQTTVFFGSPRRYLTERFPLAVDPRFPPSPYPATPPGGLNTPDWKHEWPRYLVLYGALLEEDGVRQILRTRGYSEAWIRGRWWEGDGDERKGGVRVWKSSLA